VPVRLRRQEREAVNQDQTVIGKMDELRNLALMNKDFHLIMDRAAALRVPMPAAAAAYQMNVARATCHPDEDYSSVIMQMRELAGDEQTNGGGNDCTGRVDLGKVV
jgi:3-hydroxyisobutyrate dehydrogenase-like beta-hydroxyacid dehydrogenase